MDNATPVRDRLVEALRGLAGRELRDPTRPDRLGTTARQLEQADPPAVHLAKDEFRAALDGAEALAATNDAELTEPLEAYERDTLAALRRRVYRTMGQG